MLCEALLQGPAFRGEEVRDLGLRRFRIYGVGLIGPLESRVSSGHGYELGWGGV